MLNCGGVHVLQGADEEQNNEKLHGKQVVAMLCVFQRQCIGKAARGQIALRFAVELARSCKGHVDNHLPINL
jgi:hypothetical protein